jgi:hypothetical protein
MRAGYGIVSDQVHSPETPAALHVLPPHLPLATFYLVLISVYLLARPGRDVLAKISAPARFTGAATPLEQSYAKK